MRALIDLIKGCVPPAVRPKLQAEHSLLRYPVKVEPRPILAKEQRLQADQGGAAGDALSAAVRPTGDDKTMIEMLKTILGAVNKIEYFIKVTNRGGASEVPPKGKQPGLSGFRAGSHPDPLVAFDREATKALPLCNRCANTLFEGNDIIYN
ncbi:hypothetical protein CYMTET_8653 [Cymbomonas tetramitiformis]|uniref:Uncharacterized protein n=1 Tax=Cymbomonas tetramitiformis TaxID=36881 RepID=A0AAE0GSN3_9CHLO|nr:hypothetical protein CYMTET_8653 [Cymbomonas tetramitiformis]